MICFYILNDSTSSRKKDEVSEDCCSNVKISNIINSEGDVDPYPDQIRYPIKMRGALTQNFLMCINKTIEMFIWTTNIKVWKRLFWETNTFF